MADATDNKGDSKPPPKGVKDLPLALRDESLGKKQREIFDDKTRIRVAVCGRRFGKTTLGEVAAANACADKEGAMVWWVAAAKDQSNRTYRHFWEVFKAGEWLKQDDCVKLKRLHLHNDSVIEFLTAGSGDRLRGAGLDFLVVDEAADVPEDVWASVLRPALVDRNGRALILGTPRGRGNWLHRIFHQGTLDEYAGKVKSFKFKTLDNGRTPQADLEECRTMMTDRQFEQEFNAEFLDCSGAVFKDFKPLATETLMNRGETVARYATGIDVGRRNDATVAITLRAPASGPATMTGYLRLVDKPWEQQEKEIIEHLQRFPGVALVDATGVGDPMAERLRGFCPNVEGFTFTEKRKSDLISRLQLAFNTKVIRIANVRELISELETYEYEQDEDARTYRHFPHYGAPRGHHDDCVIALALAYQALERHYGPPIVDEAGVGEPLAKPFRNGFYA